MVSRLRFLFLVVALLLGKVAYGEKSNKNEDIPSYFDKLLLSKAEAINKDESSVASFVFITDTHTPFNRMLSPKLISYLLSHTQMDIVVWGGDAIGAWGNKKTIETDWEKQTLFDSIISARGRLYKVRGNHDFTIKESSTSNNGVTLSQQKTAQLLFKNHPVDIVLNEADPAACYYFFDDKRTRVRFVVLDTTDSIKGGDIAWGTVYGVHDRQLQWIADSAIATIPKGYNIIFLSHVPFTDTTGARHKELSNVREIVDAAAKRTAGRVGNVNYDFTNLRKSSVLMCLSGHNHQDMQTYRNGVVHMVTASDAAYNDYKTDPFVKDLSGRAKGSINEVCFDCVSINKKKKLISVYRVGIGGDRFFHTKALKLKVGKSRQLKALINSNVEWRCYNASGNQYNGKWRLYNDVVDIDDHGTVICKKQGEAVALAIDEMGNKEFFNIIVR